MRVLKRQRRVITKFKWNFSIIRRLLAIMLTFIVITGSEFGFANPQGGIVTGGRATITTTQPGTMQINQTSHNAIINWQQFNIQKNESVNFNQPSHSSIILNRVNPQNGPSSIYGVMTANGQVWLINPAGIWFAPGSHVDVAGLLATTAGISDQDFMRHYYHFLQSPDWNGSVINEGTIKIAEAGLAALVGNGVVNNGYIEANLGTVILAAGSEYTVNFSGNELIAFTVGKDVMHPAVDQNGKVLPYAVSNSGVLMANGGKVLMTAHTASDILNHSINMSGVAIANSVGSKNGEIIFSSDNGTTNVSGKVYATGKNAGEAGGTVKILGNVVTLGDEAIVDASGRTGGGEIFVGGNAHGAGPEQNATITSVGANVLLLADATSTGNGGKIIVWSNDTTRVYGTLSARGGINGGSGGWIETSSANQLDVNGISVNTSAPLGATGTWLLDPTNIYIAQNQTNATTAGMQGSDNSASTGSGVNPETFQASGSVQDSLLLTGTLGTALGTTNVVVSTSNLNGTGTGNITVVDPISWSSAKTLTLTAASDIAINNTITTGATGSSLILNALGNVTQTAAIGGSGSVVQEGTGTVTLSQSNTYSGGTSVTAGTLSVTNTNGLGAAGTIAVSGSGALNINFSSSNGGTLVNSNAMTLSNTATLSDLETTNNADIVNNAIILSAGSSPTISSTSSTANGTFTLGGNISNSTAALDFAGTGNISESGIIGHGSGTLTMSGTGTLTLSGANTYTGGTVIDSGIIVGASAAAKAFGTNSITLGNSLGGSSDASLLISKSALTYANPIVLAANTTGTLTIGNAGSAISTSFSGGVTGSNNLTINSNATTGTITLKTGAVNNSGTITNVGAGTGTTTISAAVGTNVTGITENSSSSAFTISGGLTVNSSGTTLTNSTTPKLTLSGNITGTGNLVIDNNSTTTSGITLSGASINNTGTITNSGTGSGSVLISGLVSTNVTGVIENTLTSALNFTGKANTYTSGLTIDAGTVSGNVANSFGANTNMITIGASVGSANATLSGAGAVTFANPITVASGNSGTATITDSAASTFSGAVSLNNNLSLSPAASTLTLSGGITGAGNLTLNATGNRALMLSINTVNNTGSIINSGAGAGTATISAVIGSNVTGITENSTTSGLTLSGANSSYANGVTIDAGTVTVSTAANALGTGTVILGNGAGGSNAATLAVSTTGLTIANPISLASNTTGTLTLENSGTAISTTFSGGVTGNNDLTIKSNATTGTVTVSTGAINNAGTITNIGAGTGTNTISASIGSNVTSIIENSTKSSLAVSGDLSMNSSGTTLINENSSGTSKLTLSGGITGTGNLVLDNNSTIANGITLSTTSVNNAGTITNSGTATGSTLISAGVGSNVTAITENSTKSHLTISGALSLNSRGDTLTNNNASGTAVFTLSGGITGAANLILDNNSSIASGITLSTNDLHITGMLTNSGTGTGSSVISANVDSGVSSITENSTTSALTISGILTTSSSTSTALINSNSSGTALLTLSGNVAGSGNLILNNNSSIAGGIKLSGASFNNAGTITNSGSGAGDTVISGVIAAGVTGVIQNTLTSGLTMSGANTTFAGGVTIDAGTVTATTSARALGTGTLTLGNSAGGSDAATLLIGTNALTFTNPISLASNTTGTLTLGNTGLAISTKFSGGITGSNNLTINSNATTGTITLSTGAVNNAGTITNIGAGRGTTTISASVGANVTGLTENSTSSAFTISGALTANSTATTLTNSSGAKLLTLSGGANGTGNLIINNNSSTAAGVTISGSSVNNTGTITNSGTGSGSVLIGAVIGSNVTDVTENGTSTLVLSRANTYSGNTTITTGTLQTAAANVIPSGAGKGNVSVLGTLDLDGHNQTVNGLSGTGTINDVSAGGTPVLSAGGDNQTSTFSGVIQNTTGSVALTKIGSGTLTLSGANTYSGATTVRVGTLSIGNASSLGSTSGTSVTSGAALDFNFNNATLANTNTITLHGTGISGNGALTLSGASITVNNHVTTVGVTSIGGAGTGTMTFGNSISGNNNFNLSLTNAGVSLSPVTLSSGAITVVAGGTITLNRNLTAAASGDSIVLSGARFNNAGSVSLNPGRGNYLVWSSNANPFSGLTPDNRGGLSFNFKQYDATYGVTTVLGTGNGFLYSLSPQITPALTGTVTKTYNASTTATLSESNYSQSASTGIVDGDTVVFAPLTGTYATANAGTGINVSVTGISIVSASNGSATVYGYSLASNSANANIGTINAAALKVGSNAGQTKVYGNNDPGSAATAYSITSGSLYGTDTLTGSMGRVAGENVGNYAFTKNTVAVSDGNGGNNYTLTFNGTTNPFTITARPLTAAILNQDKLYGTNDPAISGIAVTLGNIVDNTVTDINGNETLINDTGNVSTTLASLSRVSGETVSSSPYSVTGATYNALSGSAANNYSAPTGLTGSPTLTITQASLTGSMANQTKVYGTNDPSLSSINVTLGGEVHTTVTNWNGQVTPINDTSSVTGTLISLSRVAGETVNSSPYAILSAGFNLSGSAASNYSSTVPLIGSPVLTITPANLTATIANQTKVYGSSDPAPASIHVLLGGVVNNSNISTWNGTVSISDTGNVNATLASLTRASGENVNTSPYLYTNATYNALTGSAASNYNVPFGLTGSPELSITPATLTYVPFATNRAYGLPNPVFDGTVTGFVNGETISSATTGTLTFTSPAVIKSEVGNYPIIGSGLTANFGNYVFTQSGGFATAFSITPALLNVVGAIANNKIFNGNTVATLNLNSATLVGVLFNDQVVLNSSGYRASFNTPTVGTGKPVTVVNLGLTGVNADDYSLLQPTGLTASILPNSGGVPYVPYGSVFPKNTQVLSSSSLVNQTNQIKLYFNQLIGSATNPIVINSDCVNVGQFIEICGFGE